MEKVVEKKNVNLTPLRAVRKYCLWCCNESANEVALCPATNCVLHKFRLNKGRIRVKDIRAKCLDCSCGEVSRVKDCPFGKALPPEKQDKKKYPDAHYENYPCPLYPYRMGKNPNKKGNPDHLVKIGYKSMSKMLIE